MFLYPCSYQKGQVTELRQKLEEASGSEEIRTENEKLWEEFDSLREERDHMENQLEEKQEEIERLIGLLEGKNIVETREGGKYSVNFRNLVYKLLGRNVPQDQVSNIINDVLSFQNKTATSLPSVPMIRRMNYERDALAHRHIGEKLQMEGLTIETDEAANLGHKVK